jgi:transcriptional regulator with XRE-family HTH domain
LPTSEAEFSTDAPVEVGERLRAIRHVKHLTLRSVAKRSEVSESFLSQVERGKANPSIASLQRIAGALGMSVSDLFDTNGGVPRPRVLRRTDRPALGMGKLGRKFLLTPRPLQHLEVFTGELDPGGSTGEEPYAHGDSEELFAVISGSVHLQLGTELFAMERGDSIDYRSSVPHRVVNVGDEPAEVIWIISPPSY